MKWGWKIDAFIEETLFSLLYFLRSLTALSGCLVWCRQGM